MILKINKKTFTEMEQRLVDLLHDARRWSDGHRDYLPTLGCSKCGQGCMPLCGLGLHRKMTPMELKDVALKSRKSMLETGKNMQPMQIQFVSSADLVIAMERALDCVEQRAIPGHGQQWVFVKPVPTVSGLICKECQACALCGAKAQDEVRHRGKRIKACNACTDVCAVCEQAKVRHHACCKGLGEAYLT
jgi:hypothetical protein